MGLGPAQKMARPRMFPADAEKMYFPPNPVAEGPRQAVEAAGRDRAVALWSGRRPFSTLDETWVRWTGHKSRATETFQEISCAYAD